MTISDAGYVVRSGNVLTLPETTSPRRPFDLPRDERFVIVSVGNNLYLVEEDLINGLNESIVAGGQPADDRIFLRVGDVEALPQLEPPPRSGR
jgi:hypothetical protein